MRSFLVAVLLAMLITGCGSPAPGTATASTTASGQATRTVEHELGSAEIPNDPERIVSTSVVLTGTLLALDAPVIGSGGSRPNMSGLDANGWFTHWSEIAQERGVQSLFTSGNLDLEAIAAADPDVIVVSATGGDSFVDNYEQLNQIAPTIVVDYNSHDWADVTRQLGEMLNRTEQAENVLSQFDAFAAEAREAIQAPAEPVNIAVYSGEAGMAVGLPTAPQALILDRLGITVADTGVTAEAGRTDFAFTSPEQANQYLTAQNLLLVGGSAADVETLLADARFSTLPSVQANLVKPLGLASFKLDYYAARELVEYAIAAYPK